MKKYRLLLDMDNVMTKTTEFWLGLYNRDYFDNLSVSDVKEWDTHKFIKPECPPGRFYAYMDHTPKFFQKLKPVEGAIEAIKGLHDLGHELYIVTATPRKCPTGFYDKIIWIERNLPFFDTKKVIATHSKHLVMGDVLFDDSPENLRLFPGVSVALNYPWNQTAQCDYRVKDWTGFVNLIKELEY